MACAMNDARRRTGVWLSILALLLGGCGAAQPTADVSVEPERREYALVVHGGAGALPRDVDPELRRAYVASLAEPLRAGCAALDAGRPSVEVVEMVVRALEDDPLFNAGRGAVLTSAGTHELDASIMDGRDLSCGAVAAVRTVRNPITLARAVMRETPHVLLVGDGAEALARQLGMPLVDNRYFTTEHRDAQFRRWRSEHGTVGAVALDRDGHLAAATSTGGLMGKRSGRVGDSPIIGAGTYADDRTCAVSCTGTGEELIRHGVARAVSARMELAGESVTEASETLVHRVLRRGDGGMIAVSRTGEIAMPFNTEGMFRGRCLPGGDVEVRIWDEPEPLER